MVSPSLPVALLPIVGRVRGFVLVAARFVVVAGLVVDVVYAVLEPGSGSADPIAALAAWIRMSTVGRTGR